MNDPAPSCGVSKDRDELFQLLLCTPRTQFTYISREVHDSVTFIVQINAAGASNGKNGLVRTTVTAFKETAPRGPPKTVIFVPLQARARRLTTKDVFEGCLYAGPGVALVPTMKN